MSNGESAVVRVAAAWTIARFRSPSATIQISGVLIKNDIVMVSRRKGARGALSIAATRVSSSRAG